MTAHVLHGDATALPLHPQSADAIVCDSARQRNEWSDFGSREHARTPAAVARIQRNKGLAFGAFSERWAAEAFRVLKPGGYLLAFGGSRTWHRLACAIEDAGFELRDSIAWMYGSGFPKSLDVSKAIDKAADAEREVVGRYESPEGTTGINSRDDEYGFGVGDMSKRLVTVPATDAVRQWQGWGTALKPAFEPIIVARKPLVGTVAANVTTWGTGALNIDGCRVEGVPPSVPRGQFAGSNNNWEMAGCNGTMSEPHAAGRWPSNVVLSHGDCGEVCEPGCPVAMLDQQSGISKSPAFDPGSVTRARTQQSAKGSEKERVGKVGHGDSGSASRFFPTFRHTPECVLFGMLMGCESVPGAANQSPRTDPPEPVTALSPASDTPSLNSGDRSGSLTSNANTAAGSPSNTPVTIGATAHAAAPTRSSGRSDLPASYADMLCGSCGTAIARSVAAMRRGHSVTRALGLPSTGDSSERILTRSLALIAEHQDSSATTSTTTDSTTSLGCVADAISMYITRASRLGARRSEPRHPLDDAPPLKYQAKAPSRERPVGPDGTKHPTCKPLELMRWLIRLVTPPGGIVLDPFAGSGTTLEAAQLEGFTAVGVEKHAPYLPLIVQRLERSRIAPTVETDWTLDLFGDAA